MPLFEPGLGHPEVSGCRPAGKPESVCLVPSHLGWTALNPKAR